MTMTTLTLAQDAAATAAPVQTIGAPTGVASAPTTATAASGTVPTQPPAGSANAGGAMGGLMLPLLLIGMFAVMMFVSSSASKKEKKKREEMLASVASNDTIQTIGGLIGRVVAIRDDEVEIESGSARLRLARSAIQTVLAKRGSAPGVTTEVKSGVMAKV